MTNFSPVTAITKDPAGREFITRLKAFPADTFETEPALAVWRGELYYAAYYGLRITGELDGFSLVDHNAPMRQIVESGKPLLTIPATFYVFPLKQWRVWLGSAHLTSRAPGIIQIGIRPPLDQSEWPQEPFKRLANELSLVQYEIEQDEGSSYRLILHWRAEEKPARNYSVFVQLTSTPNPTSQDQVLASADERAPVYGWFPTRGWDAGEVVREDYAIRPPEGYTGPLYVRVGMYIQNEDGSFENFEALVVELNQ